MKTYGNYNEDTEIRIAAYLAVMRCPSHATIQIIKDIMLKETINHGKNNNLVYVHFWAIGNKLKHINIMQIN